MYQRYKSTILCSITRSQDKALILLALVGFALAFSLALPFNENAEKSSNHELNEIANEFQEEQREG